MSGELFHKQEIMSRIEHHLQKLDQNKLQHVEHVLASLEASKNGEMHYFGKFLGVRKQGAEMIMDLGIQHENTYGVVQGGALYSLVDIAIGFMILEKVKEEEKVYTLELKLNFIKKGEGSKLMAHPRILQWGSRIVIAECTVTDDENDLVAQGLGTFYISKPRA